MLSLFQAETDFASDTALAPPRDGAAAADHRDVAPTPSALRRILVTVTTALAITRRGAGD
jgi:hypothetical protein